MERVNDKSGRGSTFSSNMERQSIVSLAGRFKNTRLAGKFSKRAAVCTIVPFVSGTGVSRWSSVTDAFIFQPPLIISSLLTAAIEESASPRKPSVVSLSKSVSVVILLVA